MNTTNQREFLQRDLIEMDRLLEVSADDPIMAFALRKRQESLKHELVNSPAAPPKPQAVIFFAGPPVLGSEGIDAMFAAAALQPFLEMVKTQYSAQKHGAVGSRGPRKDEREAKLFLTGLPRGSFGLELSQPRGENIAAAQQLSDVLVLLTQVVASAADTDERFAATFEKVSPRALPRLKDFLNVVAENNAYMRLESGEVKVVLLPEQVSKARDRVNAIQSSEKMVELKGAFRGATLDSWRFDFRTEEGLSISGRIGDEIEESAVEEMSSLLNRSCRAKLKQITITTRDGAARHRYELVGLQPSE